jgi:hypothetical protein
VLVVHHLLIPVLTQEISLDAEPLAVAWYGLRICLGFKREYKMVHAKSGEKRDIDLTIDSKTSPMVKLIPGDEPELLLAGLERVGVFLSFDGSPLPKSNLIWSQSPTVVGYCYPYVVSMVANSEIEVLSMVTNSQDQLVQRIPLPKVRALIDSSSTVMARGPASDEHDERLAGMILIATSDSLQWLEPIPFRTQIKELLAQEHVDEALALLQQTDSNSESFDKGTWQQFHVQAGGVLFRNLMIKEAIENFQKGQLDPRELLVFFPELQSSVFAYKPVLLDGVFQAAAPGSPDMKTAVKCILSQSGKNCGDKEVKQYIEQAYAQLVIFLEAAKDGALNADQHITEAIDTGLLKLYVLLGHPKLDSFAGSKNSCDLMDAKIFLSQHQLYHVLALLFKGRGSDRDALDIWSRMGSGEYREPGHDGVGPTVECLAQQENQELVWIFSYWVLRDHPEEGLKIFIKGSGVGQPEFRHLHPHKVLQHLESFSGQQSQQLCEAYLEDLVFNQENVEEHYHT